MTTKNIIILLLLIAAGIAGFYWYSNKKNSQVTKADTENETTIQPKQQVPTSTNAPQKSTTDFNINPEEVVTIIPYNETGLYVYKGKFAAGRVEVSIDKNNTLHDYLVLEKENLGAEKIKVLVKPAKNCSGKNISNVMKDISTSEIKNYGMDGISKEEQSVIDGLQKNH